MTAREMLLKASKLPTSDIAKKHFIKAINNEILVQMQVMGGDIKDSKISANLQTNIMLANMSLQKIQANILTKKIGANLMQNNLNGELNE